MPESASPVRIVLTTAGTPEEAEQLARTIVEEQLAACATILPAAKSIYRWQGEIEANSETLLLLKTLPEKLTALEARLHALHSYEIPEFLVLHAERASADYLDWLITSLKGL
jgi:periplasmic divalent cation tolerance protein